MGIYVEIRIRASMEELWRLTQLPDLHQQWDLRFSRIHYLPRNDATSPQRFLYTTRIGCGLAISGEGESIQSRNEAEGTQTSALRFWSNNSKSLIRDGAGYWQYIPTDDGIRFVTRYDYRTRFGMFGRIIDAVCFGPLLGWATAWSFDRLRLWLEKGIPPAVSWQRSLLHWLSRCTLAAVWIYQGVVPKLVWLDRAEQVMIRNAGVSFAASTGILKLLGWSEVVVGLWCLLGGASRWPFMLTIAAMMVAFGNVAICSPEFLAGAFNPMSLNVLMISMAFVALLSRRDLPSARHCLRFPPEKTT